MDILCDIDGTLADRSHRLHFIETKPKNWDAFFAAAADDAPIQPVCDAISDLMEYNRIIFVTGRPERTRIATSLWLSKRAVLWPDYLFMRKDGDYRPDEIIKEELLDQLLAAGHKPVLVFDDRKRVVEMWRRRGLICAQVAEGDF